MPVLLNMRLNLLVSSFFLVCDRDLVRCLRVQVDRI